MTHLESFDFSGLPGSGHIHVEIESEFPAALPYDLLTDNQVEFNPSLLPAIGQEVEAVIFNFVNGRLYLTAQPRELEIRKIEIWQQYYDYIDTIHVGDYVTGIVQRVKPFGLFVDIGAEFLGLIDLGHSLAL